jgi:hypothetical protein
MKNGIWIIVLLILINISVEGQQWTGTNPVWTDSNVGIGIHNPAYKLDVNGNVRISGDVLRIINSNTSSSGYIDFGLSDVFLGYKTTGLFNLQIWDNTDYFESLRINGLDHYTILAPSEGNVGIGTTTPGYKLDVNGSIHVSGYSELFGSGGKIYGQNDANNYYIGHYTVPSSDGLDIHWFGGIRLGDWTGNVMQITDGNVGIGTTSPGSYKLNVAGNVLANGLNIAGNALFGNGVSAYLGLRRADGSVVGTFTEYSDGSGLLIRQGGGDSYIDFSTNATVCALRILDNGNIGIGTTSPGIYKLNVNGSIRANEVVVNTTGADFVFNENYSLPDLSEVEEFINENKRLPDIASAKEMQQNGISISEMQTKLLQKIEELTIYTIEQDKRSRQQNEKILMLEEKIKRLEVLK